MGAKKGPVTVAVEELAAPVAQRLGLKIWDIEFVKEGASWFLRIFIDKEGGISIDDCEAFSRAIDGPLDEADPIDQQYYLEVSSPGIERVLRRDWHFQTELGEPVQIRMIRPLESGERELRGILKGYDGGLVTLEADGREFSVKQADTAFVKLIDTQAYDFD